MVYVMSHDTATKAPTVVRLLCSTGEKLSYLIGVLVKSETRWKKVYDSKNQPANLGK